MVNDLSKPPLAGLRVIDFTTMIAGPYCARLLADCGAEVIKIETDDGDYIRKATPMSDGVSSYFGHLNCGKKSVVLDLRSDEGNKAAFNLVASADVVVENFRPGVMDRLGLNYARLANDHPDLIYCAISGFGQTGPRAADPAYAPIVHAASGFDQAQLEYQDELTRPEKSGIFIADVLAGTYGFGAIQTALLGRERHGGGQFIDVALMDSMINLLVHECQIAQNPPDQPKILYTPTRTLDGFVIVTPVTPRNFRDMAHAMGHAEWLNDPRFISVSARRENWPKVVEVMEDWTSQRTSRAAEDELLEAGVPCSRYRTIGEAMTDPQSVARGLMVHVDNTEGGFKVPNPPFQFSDGTVGVVPKVPTLGEHSKEVLATLGSKA